MRGGNMLKVRARWLAKVMCSNSTMVRARVRARVRVRARAGLGLGLGLGLRSGL